MGERGRPKHPDILTPRQFEVLELVREGLTNPQIAERLGISYDGAKWHVKEILWKLDVPSREEAARWQRETASSTEATGRTGCNFGINAETRRTQRVSAGVGKERWQAMPRLELAPLRDSARKDRGATGRHSGRCRFRRRRERTHLAGVVICGAVA